MKRIIFVNTKSVARNENVGYDSMSGVYNKSEELGL